MAASHDIICASSGQLRPSASPTKPVSGSRKFSPGSKKPLPHEPPAKGVGVTVNAGVVATTIAVEVATVVVVVGGGLIDVAVAVDWDAVPVGGSVGRTVFSGVARSVYVPVATLVVVRVTVCVGLAVGCRVTLGVGGVVSTGLGRGGLVGAATVAVEVRGRGEFMPEGLAVGAEGFPVRTWTLASPPQAARNAKSILSTGVYRRLGASLMTKPVSASLATVAGHERSIHTHRSGPRLLRSLQGST